MDAVHAELLQWTSDRARQ